MDQVVLVRMFEDRGNAEKALGILREYHIDSLIKTDAQEGYSVSLKHESFPYKLYVKRVNFEKAAEIIENENIKNKNEKKMTTP